MKKLAVICGAVALALSSPLAWASCTSHTYFMNGKYVTCTTCCYGGNCTTSCF